MEILKLISESYVEMQRKMKIATRRVVYTISLNLWYQRDPGKPNVIPNINQKCYYKRQILVVSLLGGC